MATSKELEKIKKLYGKQMMQFCRSNFADLLEKEDCLTTFLQNRFEPNKFLIKDIIEQGKTGEFISFVKNNTLSIPLTSNEKARKNPFELMKKANYELFECKTNQDVEKFKKYYISTELLCTYKHLSNRLAFNHIFFAVKKNIDEINRKDFKTPHRQDDYGTSCISLQFSKNKESTLSIKNRYNHTVANPDATFANNLNNIVPTLQSSFEKYLNIKLYTKDTSFELDNYTADRFGKFFKYNKEINGIYYLTCNKVFKNYDIISYNPDEYVLFDHFVLCKNKEQGLALSFVDKNINDSFVEYYKDIVKIEEAIIKDNNEKLKQITITKSNNTTSIITINSQNQMVGYSNHTITTLDKNFLRNASYLKKLDMPNLQTMECNCFKNADNLETLSLPSLKSFGENCFYSCNNLSALNLPNCIKMNNGCFQYCNFLCEIYANNLEWIGRNCFTECESLKSLNLESLQTIGWSCFAFCNSLSFLKLNNLTSIQQRCFNSCNNLEILNLPKLCAVEQNCFQHCEKLKNVNLQNVTFAHDCCFNNCNSLESLEMPNVKFMGYSCFENCDSLKNISLNNLISMDSLCFKTCNSATFARLNNLTEIGRNCLKNCKSLAILNAPKLKIIKNQCFYRCDSLKNIQLNSLEKIGPDCFYNCNSATQIELKNLKILKQNNFKHIKSLKNISLPKVFRNSNKYILLNIKFKTKILANKVANKISSKLKLENSKTQKQNNENTFDIV